MNTARELMDFFMASGYTLRAKEGGKLGVSPPPPSDLLEELKAHKAELLALLAAPANDKHHDAVTDQQIAFLGRPPLVEEDELHGIQRALMRHLVDCRACNVNGHAYCRDGERIGLGYWSFLFEFRDGDDRHREYAKAVALAQRTGLREGISALMRTYTGFVHNRLEARMGAAWLAFDEHTATCSGCLRRAGRFCAAGREMHEAAKLEGLQ